MHRIRFHSAVWFIRSSKTDLLAYRAQFDASLVYAGSQFIQSLYVCVCCMHTTRSCSIRVHLHFPRVRVARRRFEPRSQLSSSTTGVVLNLALRVTLVLSEWCAPSPQRLLSVLHVLSCCLHFTLSCLLHAHTLRLRLLHAHTFTLALLLSLFTSAACTCLCLLHAHTLRLRLLHAHVHVSVCRNRSYTLIAI